MDGPEDGSQRGKIVMKEFAAIRMFLNRLKLFHQFVNSGCFFVGHIQFVLTKIQVSQLIVTGSDLSAPIGFLKIWFGFAPRVIDLSET